MKQFLKGVVEWKTSASLLYTAAMFFYLVFSLLFGNRETSIAMLWGMFGMCVAASLVQALCFSNWIIKKMRYTRRSLLFVVLFLPVLSLAAWKMEWFPTERLGSWAIFIGAFFLIFIAMTVGFDIYFQISGRKYDGLIGQYRKQKEADD